MYKIKAQYRFTSEGYVCEINNKVIDERIITKFCGRKRPTDCTDDKVTQINFFECKMDFLPRGITECFPNLKLLLVAYTPLKKLCKDDFNGMDKLTDLVFDSCEIEYLPGDLFEHTKNLEMVTFLNCKIKYIDWNILDGLPKLKFANFLGNINIDALYNSSQLSEISLNQLKQLLKSRDLERPNSVIEDLKAFLKKDEFKDAKVIVGSEVFKAHKAILVARSPLLAGLLQTTSTIELVDIKSETFAGILDYLYTDKYPKSVNTIDLIKSAYYLELPQLMEPACEHLKDEPISDDNAFDVMCIAKTFNMDKLQKAAFEKIKTMIPDKTFKDEWIDDLEKIKAIIEGKKILEMKLKRAKEEFDMLFF